MNPRIYKKQAKRAVELLRSHGGWPDVPDVDTVDRWSHPQATGSIGIDGCPVFWRSCYTDCDKKVKGLGRDKAAAFTQARAANAALANEKKSTLVDWVLGKADYSLAEWLPIYMRLWIERSPKPPSPNTVRSCAANLKKMEACDYAWRKLRDIETAHVAPHLAQVTKDSGPSAALALRVRMHDVFRLAETQGLIVVGRNPVAATYSPDRTVKRERLTLEQFLLIREAAPGWLKRAMNLALLTGQRREDIANFKFADFNDGHLHVVQGKSGGKTRLRLDGRIGLDAVKMTIAQPVQDCRDNVVSKYLLHHVEHISKVKPGEGFSPVSLTNRFAQIRDAVGVKASEGRTPPSFHEIRSLAERLYRDQYGAEFAQAILGHKNASMTSKYDDMRGLGWNEVTAGNL